ncbi:MAG: AI-2E family transporter [Saprospiraceae bacterium]
MTNSNRYIAISLSFVIVAAIFYYFSSIVAYVLIAWVISMMGQPLMDFFTKHLRVGKFHAGKNTCAALTLFVFLSLFTSLLLIFVPTGIKQAQNLTEIDYPRLVQSLEEPLEDWNRWFAKYGLINGNSPELSDSLTVESPINTKEEVTPPTVKEKVLSKSMITVDSILLANGDTITRTNIALNIKVDVQQDQANEQQGFDSSAEVQETDTALERLQKKLFSFFNPAQITELFSSLVGFLGNLMVAFMSILFISFFFLKEQGLFVDFLRATVPRNYESKVSNAVDEASQLLRRYFLGVALQITLITIFVTALLSFFGIENALLIGFFAAMINVIPYVGPIIGASFGIFITISSNLDVSFYNETLPMLTKVAGVFAAMQMLDNFILQPYIFSNSISAHPLEIFIVILVGAQLNGVVGMILAIPVYTVIRVIARVFLSEFEIVQKLLGQPEEVP